MVTAKGDIKVLHYWPFERGITGHRLHKRACNTDNVFYVMTSSVRHETEYHSSGVLPSEPCPLHVPWPVATEVACPVGWPSRGHSELTRSRLPRTQTTPQWTPPAHFFHSKLGLHSQGLRYILLKYHLHENIVILTNFPPRDVPEIIILTTSGATRDEKCVKMIFPFQCMKRIRKRIINSCVLYLAKLSIYISIFPSCQRLRAPAFGPIMLVIVGFSVAAYRVNRAGRRQLI